MSHRKWRSTKEARVDAWEKFEALMEQAPGMSDRAIVVEIEARLHFSLHGAGEMTRDTLIAKLASLAARSIIDAA